jgi:hypothetical protein
MKWRRKTVIYFVLSSLISTFDCVESTFIRKREKNNVISFSFHSFIRTFAAHYK